MSARGSPISAARYADADATADALPPPSLAALLRTARTRLADREELCRSLRAKLSEAQHALCQHQVSTQARRLDDQHEADSKQANEDGALRQELQRVLDALGHDSLPTVDALTLEVAQAREEVRRSQAAMREQSARSLAALRALRAQQKESEQRAEREHERAESLAQRVEEAQDSIREQSTRSLACIQTLRAQLDGKHRAHVQAANSDDALPATLRSPAVLQAYAKRLHVHIESTLDEQADTERAGQKLRLDELDQQKVRLKARLRIAERQGGEGLADAEEALANHELLLEDAHRKHFFPEADGYRLSWLADGFVIGVKDFRVCKLHGRFSVSVGSGSSVPEIFVRWGAIPASSPASASPRRGNDGAGAGSQQQSGGVLKFQAEDVVIHNTKPLGLVEWQTTRFKRLFVEMRVELRVSLKWASAQSCWTVGPDFEVDIVDFQKEIVGDLNLPSFVLKMLVRRALKQDLRQFALEKIPVELATYMQKAKQPLLELAGQIHIEGLDATLLDIPLERLSTQQLRDWLGLTPRQLMTLQLAQHRFSLTPFALATMRQLLEYQRYHTLSEATRPQWRRLLQLWQRAIDLTVAASVCQGDMSEVAGDEDAPTVDFESVLARLWEAVGRQPLKWSMSVAHIKLHAHVDALLSMAERWRARAVAEANNEGRQSDVDGKPPPVLPLPRAILEFVKDNVHRATLSTTGELHQRGTPCGSADSGGLVRDAQLQFEAQCATYEGSLRQGFYFKKAVDSSLYSRVGAGEEGTFEMSFLVPSSTRAELLAPQGARRAALALDLVEVVRIVVGKLAGGVSVHDERVAVFDLSPAPNEKPPSLHEPPAAPAWRVETQARKSESPEGQRSALPGHPTQALHAAGILGNLHEEACTFAQCVFGAATVLDVCVEGAKVTLHLGTVVDFLRDWWSDLLAEAPEHEPFDAPVQRLLERAAIYLFHTPLQMSWALSVSATVEAHELTVRLETPAEADCGCALSWDFSLVELLEDLKVLGSFLHQLNLRSSPIEHDIAPAPRVVADNFELEHSGSAPATPSPPTAIQPSEFTPSEFEADLYI